MELFTKTDTTLVYIASAEFEKKLQAANNNMTLIFAFMLGVIKGAYLFMGIMT